VGEEEALRRMRNQISGGRTCGALGVLRIGAGCGDLSEAGFSKCQPYQKNLTVSSWATEGVATLKISGEPWIELEIFAWVSE
jgi:hypothetical protein